MVLKCQVHADQLSNHESLETLKEFALGHGGDIDMQQARLRVALRSSSEAQEFLTLLLGIKIHIQRLHSAEVEGIKIVCAEALYRYCQNGNSCPGA